MTRLLADAPNVNGSPKPRQFTIRSLMILTFGLAILLTLYVRLPKWIYFYLQIAVMATFAVMMFSGLILAVVDFYKRNRGQH